MDDFLYDIVRKALESYVLVNSSEICLESVLFKFFLSSFSPSALKCVKTLMIKTALD